MAARAWAHARVVSGNRESEGHVLAVSAVSRIELPEFTSISIGTGIARQAIALIPPTALFPS
jgi:hypothetical protein